MRLLPYIPLITLAVILTAVGLTDNDKAPFLLAAPLAISVAFFIILLMRPHKWALRLLALAPWIYVAGAVVLSRAGLVDSALTLGFR